MTSPEGKWLAVDPGEDTGWALFQGIELVEAGTEKLWAFGDAVFEAVFTPERLIESDLGHQFIGLTKLVVEDFRVYPWSAKDLAWDQVRTARLIGALTMIARQGRLEFVLQPAKIKERAEAAGAKALFTTPLNENRHSNDACRHGWFHIHCDKP